MVVAHIVTIIKPSNILPTQHHSSDFIGAQTNVSLLKNHFDLHQIHFLLLQVFQGNSWFLMSWLHLGPA